MNLFIHARRYNVTHSLPDFKRHRLFLVRLFKSTHIFKTISACLSVHAAGSNLEVIPHLSGDRVDVTPPDGRLKKKDSAAAAEHMWIVCVTCTCAGRALPAWRDAAFGRGHGLTSPGSEVSITAFFNMKGWTSAESLCGGEMETRLKRLWSKKEMKGCKIKES